jgi:P27 family predicted phage terminase small subunit
MPPGPPPKPTHLKLLTGNPGKRAINHDEPRPVGDLDEAPEWLTPLQRQIWSEAIAAAPPGLLKRLDASILCAYVVAADLHKLASQKVVEWGAIIKAPITGVPMQSPWVSIMNKQAAIMMRAAAEMGFSPSSRSRVKIEHNKAASSRFSELKELGD